MRSKLLIFALELPHQYEYVFVQPKSLQPSSDKNVGIYVMHHGINLRYICFQVERIPHTNE